MQSTVLTAVVETMTQYSLYNASHWIFDWNYVCIRVFMKLNSLNIVQNNASRPDLGVEAIATSWICTAVRGIRFAEISDNVSWYFSKRRYLRTTNCAAYQQLKLKRTSFGHNRSGQSATGSTPKSTPIQSWSVLGKTRLSETAHIFILSPCSES